MLFSPSYSVNTWYLLYNYTETTEGKIIERTKKYLLYCTSLAATGDWTIHVRGAIISYIKQSGHLQLKKQLNERIIVKWLISGCNHPSVILM